MATAIETDENGDTCLIYYQKQNRGFPAQRQEPKNNMPRGATKQMLTLGEVYEMEPGTEQDAAWINPGFTAVISKMTRTKSRSNQPMFICTLQDPSGGKAELGVTFFDTCEFTEGDVLEFSGKGLRRTVYKGLQQVSIGRETAVIKVGRSAHTPAPSQTPGPGAAAAPGSVASPGQLVGIFGGTVGMAMKESIALHTGGYEPEAMEEILNTPDLWEKVYTTASDIIRISILLEKGKLAPSVSKRTQSPQEKAAEEKAEKEKAEAAEKARLAKEAEEKAKANDAKKVQQDDTDDIPF